MQQFDGPPPQVPVIDVPLSEEEWNNLERYLIDEHEEALKDRKSLEEEWEENVKQYNARMKRKDASSQDSDIDMPTTFKYARVEQAAMVAPLFTQIDPDSFVVVKKRAKRVNVDPRNYQEIIDQIVDNSEYQKLATIMFRNAQVFNYCVVKAAWQKDTETVLQMFDEQDPELRISENNGTIESIAIYRKQRLIERTMTVREGCFPVCVPVQDYIFPWYGIEHRTLPWETHRVWLIRNELEDRAESGQFPKKFFEEVGDPDSTRPKVYDVEQSQKDMSATRKQDRHYQYMETFLSYKAAGHNRPVEMIARWLYNPTRSGKSLLSVKYNWLTEYRRPFSVWAREERDDGIPGIGLCYRLKYLHTARSAIMNIGLDSAVRAANTTLFINSTSDLTRHFPGNILRPGIYPTTADVDKDLKQFRLSYDAVPLENHLGMIDSDSAMVVGQTDADMGKDVAERPTATGTTKVLEASSLPRDVMRESFRKELAHIVKMQLARYKQFMPDGLQNFIKNQDQFGHQADAQLLTWPEGTIEENIIIETRVSSATISRDIKKQEKLALVKQLPEVTNVMLQLATTAAEPSNPASQMAMDMLFMYASAVDDMFREFDLRDQQGIAVKFVADLQNGMQLAQILQRAQQALQENQMLNQQNQQLQTEGVQIGQQNQSLAKGLQQTQMALQQAQLENFHLGRAFRGFSPGPIVGPGAPVAAPGLAPGMPEGTAGSLPDPVGSGNP